MGALLLVADGPAARLTGVHWPQHRRAPRVAAAWERDDGAFDLTLAQLGEYFAGERTRFELPIDPQGTPFQHRVWDALQEIPYGETITYAELAARVGRAGAARAAGLANGSNPLSIVIPCHRVVGHAGGLTGYAGGLDVKRRLLEHERAFAAVPAGAGR